MTVAFAPELKDRPPSSPPPVLADEVPRVPRAGYERDPLSFAPAEGCPDDLGRLDRVGILYSSGLYRAESLERRSILNGTALERFNPPPPPPGNGKTWDPEALRARNGFLLERAELSRSFTTQATSREWLQIEHWLRRAKSVLEALHALAEMEVFLATDPYVTRIDAESALETLSTVQLPFERLVRNVWVEGPEVQYDRAKVLAREVQTRRRALAEGLWEPIRFGPRGEVDQLVQNLELQHKTRQAPKFKGMGIVREKPTSVQAGQSALLASFRKIS
ncbi:hypothetical protein T492DRAFT_854753 [Pavlovales sp. CCMP2436]|nr:hypothetical protein T492DRAFT_854753 [Pavlovales sp. CCMP2436]